MFATLNSLFFLSRSSLSYSPVFIVRAIVCVVVVVVVRVRRRKGTTESQRFLCRERPRSREIARRKKKICAFVRIVCVCVISGRARIYLEIESCVFILLFSRARLFFLHFFFFLLSALFSLSLSAGENKLLEKAPANR